MSELSQLIEISKNIERQNEEIISLLKVIAGQKDSGYETPTVEIPYVAPPSHEIITEAGEGDILDVSLDVGEVLYVEEKNIFKLTLKNNEITLDNLTGSEDSVEFALQEFVANESVRLNQPISPSTVILSKEQSLNLPETLNLIVMQAAKKLFIPITAMTQLIGAPEELMSIIMIDFYRTDEELIEKLFETGD